MAVGLHGYNHDWDIWVTLDQILTQIFTLSHVVYYSKDVSKSGSNFYLTATADELKLLHKMQALWVNYCKTSVNKNNNYEALTGPI